MHVYILSELLPAQRNFSLLHFSHVVLHIRQQREKKEKCTRTTYVHVHLVAKLYQLDSLSSENLPATLSRSSRLFCLLLVLFLMSTRWFLLSLFSFFFTARLIYEASSGRAPTPWLSFSRQTPGNSPSPCDPFPRTCNTWSRYSDNFWQCVLRCYIWNKLGRACLRWGSRVPCVRSLGIYSRAFPRVLRRRRVRRRLFLDRPSGLEDGHRHPLRLDNRELDDQARCTCSNASLLCLDNRPADDLVFRSCNNFLHLSRHSCNLWRCGPFGCTCSSDPSSPGSP